MSLDVYVFMCVSINSNQRKKAIHLRESIGGDGERGHRNDLKVKIKGGKWLKCQKKGNYFPRLCSKIILLSMPISNSYDILMVSQRWCVFCSFVKFQNFFEYVI